MQQLLEQAPAQAALAVPQESLYVIDHIAIAVEDLESSVEWFCGRLGFQLIERRTTRGQRTSMSSAVVVLGQATVVLIQGHEPECQVNRFIQQFGAGVQHVALRVPDLDTALSQFPSTESYADTAVIEGDGIRQVFLTRTGGSGVRLELIERNGGSFSDQSVQKLFLDFERRDLY